MRQYPEKIVIGAFDPAVVAGFLLNRLIVGNPPVEEPPNEPQEPPVEEPGDIPDGPSDPNRPPMEEPWNDPSQPPVEEPPPEDPNQAPPQPPPRRLM